MPLRPSIDRVLSTGGFKKDSVRLVCLAVNFGLDETEHKVCLTLARAAVDHERHSPRDKESTFVRATGDLKDQRNIDVEKCGGPSKISS